MKPDEMFEYFGEIFELPKDTNERLVNWLNRCKPVPGISWMVLSKEGNTLENLITHTFEYKFSHKHGETNKVHYVCYECKCGIAIYVNFSDYNLQGKSAISLGYVSCIDSCDNIMMNRALR